jgi:hypothetical protein
MAGTYRVTMTVEFETTVEADSYEDAKNAHYYYSDMMYVGVDEISIDTITDDEWLEDEEEEEPSYIM